MSLISLLVALFSEKSLSKDGWQFEYYFPRYLSFYKGNKVLSSLKRSTLSYTIFLVLPPLALYLILSILGNGVLNLILSTLVLIITLGCKTTRVSYKAYLNSAFRGETTTSEMHHLQLLEDKNLPALGFGQALVWLNYRYYIAIMFFFILFGAAGALFYRLLTSITEQQGDLLLDNACDDGIKAEGIDVGVEDIDKSKSVKSKRTMSDEGFSMPCISNGCKNYHDVLFYVDWLPVRLSSLGYMFVGHFSKAFPTWIETIFSAKKANYEVLIDVAQQSEDIVVDNEDLTAEPSLLVKLAKRNVLLILSILSVLILAGVIR